MIAGTLELNFLTNLAQVSSELSQIKRAVGQTMGEAVASYNSLSRSADAMTASLERQAATHGKTADQIRAMDVAAKALALNEAGLTEQAQKLIAAEQALSDARKNVANDTDHATASGHQYSMGQVVMQSAIRRTTDQFAAGANVSTIFAEHIGTLVEVLQLYAQQSRQAETASAASTAGLALVGAKAAETEEKVGGFKGMLGAAAGFLAGPWGIAITAGVSVLAILGPKLFETGEAAKAAEKQLKAFQDRQSDMGRFIDVTTGKLKEQARQLALIAQMQLPAQISAQAGTTQGFVNQAFATARAALTSTTSGDLLMRAQLNQAIIAAGSNVQVLNRNLAALTQRHPELQALSNTIASYAGEAAEAAKQIGTLQGHQTTLNTLLSGGVVVTTAMIDRQVALATAHTAVAKAQQHLTDVKERSAQIDAMDDGPAKAAALAEYTRDLTAASKAVNAAEDAQKAYRKGLSEEAKAEREAAAAAKARAAVFAQMNKLNLQPISAQMDKEFEKQWAEDWTNTIKEVAEVQKGFANDAALTVKANIQAEHDQLLSFMDEVKTTAHDLSDAWGNVGTSIGDAMVTLAEYGKKQKELADQKSAFAISDAEYSKQSSDAQLSMLMGIAQATEGLFKKHSAGAKAAQAAEKALAAVELARTIANVAGGAAKMFQVSGPAGFGLVAAMLAVMASLGFAGGGGGSGSAPKYDDGKGTTLGDSDHASESIKNAIAALADVDRVTMAHSAEMATSLKSIDSHIGNLASLLVRTGNISGASAGIATGFQSNGIGTAVATALLPLNSVLKHIPVVGDIVSGITGIIKSLFGTTTKIVGSGLSAGPQSLSSILGSGFDLQTFADVSKTRKFLGIKTGTSTSTQYGSADQGVADQFTLILKQFDDAITAAGGPLGVATGDISKRLDGFVLDLGKIDFTGLSGTEIQDKLSAVFGAAADNMAAAAIPGLAKFQKVGEGAFDTLVRVANTVEAVTVDLAELGKSTAGLGIDAKMSIASMFSSTDAMTSAVQTYFTTFYTSEEQLAVKTQQLNGAFTSLGVAMPSTLAGFRALVDAQDLTTAAGQSTYAMLIQLAPAFAAVAGAAKDATSAAAILREGQDLQKQLLEAQGDTAALRALELASIDPANQAIQLQIWALQDQKAAADAAAQAVQEQAQAAQEAAQAAQAAAQKTDALRQAWQSIGQTIEDEINRIRNLTGTGTTQSFAQLMAQFNAATDAARHGDQAAATSLPGLSKSLLDAAALVATSQQELDRVQAQTAASLEQTLAMVNAATAASQASTSGVLGSDTSAADSSNWWSNYAPQAPADTANLRNEVAGLRSDLRTGLAAIAGHTKKTATILNDVSNGAQTINTTVAA